jgi:hypothetical protein
MAVGTLKGCSSNVAHITNSKKKRIQEAKYSTLAVCRFMMVIRATCIIIPPCTSEGLHTSQNLKVADR